MPKQKDPIKPVEFGELKEPVKNRFGAYRHHGSHAGIDIYKKEDTAVKASLGGTVVRSSSEAQHKGYGKGYGDLVIIDHTPERKPGQEPFLRFNLYTLYAHLKNRNVKLGKRVYKGDTIGTVGNTGNARKMDPHLHFEVIRSPETLGWNTSGNTGVDAGKHRIDPLPFLSGHTLLGPGYEDADPLEDEEIKDKLIQRMHVDPHIDLKRKTWWMEVKLGGKKVGRIDRHNKEIKLNLSPEEVEEILTQPPVSPGKKELAYEIKI